MQIENKTFLVTGAGSGIGKELSLLLVENGANVAAVDLNKETLDELKKSVPDKIETYTLDIADKKAIDDLTKNIGGKIDGLINNAGIIQPFVKVNDLSYDDIEKVMNVNFFGALFMTKAFLPDLLKRPEAHIVNVSSMGGFLPVPGQSVYGASKAAIKLLTEGLYAELKNTNVGITVVFPGATATNITKNSGLETPKENSGKKFPTLPARKVAEIIVAGILKNKFQIFTGKDSKMMNFLYRLNPRFATNLIAKQMKSLLK